MIKRFLSATLCLATLCLVLVASAFSVGAESLSKVDTKVVDAKLYVDNDKVQKGDMVTVTIYIENITAKDGVISVELPLCYDRTKLSFIKLDCIYPSAWGLYGDFMGSTTPTEEPWYLRSNLDPDVSDFFTNPTYRIKADKQIGFKLVFKAMAEGEAYVAVEDVANNKIMAVSLEADDVVNYGGNGMRVNIQIGGKEDTSSTAPDISDESSKDVSDEPVSGDVSGDMSSEDVSTEESSEEPVSNEPSSEAVSEDLSQSDASSEASTEASEVTSEESKSNDKSDETNGGGFPTALIVVMAVVAAAALLGVGGFLFMKKKTDKEDK